MSQIAAYNKNETDHLVGRELEAHALMKSAGNLNLLKQSLLTNPTSDLNPLSENQRLWTHFQISMLDEECKLPQDLKLNILRLAAFIDKRTFQLFSDPKPQGFDILINININIAKGLRTKS